MRIRKTVFLQLLPAAMAAALLAPALHASKFELAEEWPAVSFRDGGLVRVRFIHMSDLDVPSFDLPDSSAPARRARTGAPDLYVPLYELSVKDVRRQDGRPGGDVTFVAFSSLPTRYKLHVRLDKNGQHLITRAPDFQTTAGSQLDDLIDVFQLRAADPKNVLVMVRPGQPAPAQDKGLGDVELAAIASLDNQERAAAAGVCQAEPGDPRGLPCWRATVRKVLAERAASASEPEPSPFHRRYMKQRLSVKGYAKYQRAMELPAGSPERTSLLKDWDDNILSLDIKEYLASSGPALAEAAPAPQTAAPAPTVAASGSAPVPSKAPAVNAPVPPAPAVRESVRPAKAQPAKATPTLPKTAPEPSPLPQEAPAPRPHVFPLRRFMLGCVVLLVIIYMLLRRLREKN